MQFDTADVANKAEAFQNHSAMVNDNMQIPSFGTGNSMKYLEIIRFVCKLWKTHL